VAFGGAVWVGDGQVSVVVESEFPSAFHHRSVVVPPVSVRATHLRRRDRL